MSARRVEQAQLQPGDSVGLASPTYFRRTELAAVPIRAIGSPRRSILSELASEIRLALSWASNAPGTDCVSPCSSYGSAAAFSACPSVDVACLFVLLRSRVVCCWAHNLLIYLIVRWVIENLMYLILCPSCLFT